MTRPRIAYVINSLEGGGAALPVPSLAKVLQDEGADVRVFALTRRNGKALPPIAEAGLDPLVRDGGEKDHLAALRWMREVLTRWGATHIWTSLSRATILGLILGPQIGLPVIAWQHNALLKPWNLRLMRLLQRRATMWVGDSHFVTELTAERLGVERERLACWPIYSADPAMPQASPWQPGETLRLGSLGRLHPNKGYDLLIAALGQLKREGFTPPAPFEIAIAGEGDKRAELEAQMAAMGIGNVTLSGYTEDPRAFLAQQHLYLQPSRHEGFCIAAHEALTAGLPVLGTRVGEMGYSIRDRETGFIVPPEDSSALADALRIALSAPDRLAGMGVAARADTLSRFSWDRFAEAGASAWRRANSAVS